MVNKKSQTAMEFVVLVAALLFFFISFFIALEGNISSKSREKTTKMFNEVAFIVQDEINLASRSSDGYYREFRVPDDVNGLNYEINLMENMVYLKSSDERYAVAFPVKNYTGNVVKGNNIIKNQNGSVRLN